MLLARHRQGQHIQVRRHSTRTKPCIAQPRQRQNRQRDKQHVQRKEPACRAQMRWVATLHHAGVELMRQGEHRQCPQQDQRGEARAVMRRRCGVHEVGRQRRKQQRAQGEHRAQLEQRFERHRQHQSTVMRHRRRTPCSEQHREQRHQQGDIERAVLPRFGLGNLSMTEHRVTHRHRFELQRDIRHDADHHHRRDHRRQTRMAPQAYRDQVSQRTRVVIARELHQATQHGNSKQIHQDRADKRRRQPPS